MKCEDDMAACALSRFCNCFITQNSRARVGASATGGDQLFALPDNPDNPVFPGFPARAPFRRASSAFVLSQSILPHAARALQGGHPETFFDGAKKVARDLRHFTDI